jgi:tetratricopeptide (TPR) repeat protein
VKSQKTTAGLLAALALGFALLWQLQEKIDPQLGAMHQEQDELTLRSPKLVKLLSLEYAPLMADVYWTRAVQYYGKEHAGPNPRYALLWPLLDISTTLDPNLLPAYRFGAVFLSDSPPRGAGRPDQAIELIQRGIKENPEYWRFYEDLGFVYYFDLKDYPKAAKAFEDGSKIPNANLWMKVMAAKIAEEGESLETSIFLWKQVAETTTDPEVARNAKSHLQLLYAEEDCKQIDRLSAEYEKKIGRKPARVSDLVRAGFLRGEPVDSMGYPYTIGEDGKAELNLESPLLERQVMLEQKK